MSAQIDIISEPSGLGQGSWVRVEEIAKASTATLDDRSRFAARSVNLTWPLCVGRSLRPITDESEMKPEAKSLFAGFFLLGCDDLGDLPREDTDFFRISTQIFLQISRIDTKMLTTVYKKVIIVPKRGGRFFVILAYLLSDSWRCHGCDFLSRTPVRAELRSEIELGAASSRVFGETRRRHGLWKIRAKS
jgi:hypothetical protein